MMSATVEGARAIGAYSEWASRGPTAHSSARPAADGADGRMLRYGIAGPGTGRQGSAAYVCWQLQEF